MDFVYPLKVLAYFHCPNKNTLNNYILEDINRSIDNNLTNLDWMVNSKYYNIHDLRLITTLILKSKHHPILLKGCTNIGKAFYSGYKKVYHNIHHLLFHIKCTLDEWIYITNSILWGIAFTNDIRLIKTINNNIITTNPNLQDLYWNYNKTLVYYAIFNNKKEIISCLLCNCPERVPQYYFLAKTALFYQKYDLAQYFHFQFDDYDYAYILPFILDRTNEKFINKCVERTMQINADYQFFQSVIGKIIIICLVKKRKDIVLRLEHLLINEMWEILINNLQNKNIQDSDIIIYLQNKINNIL